jgi:hypothetical protein
VCWVQLLDWDGLDVGERDRAQILTLNATATIITKTRMYFLDIFTMLIIALLPLLQKIYAQIQDRVCQII